MLGRGVCLPQRLVSVAAVYLLDTNHCSRAIRGDLDIWRRLATNVDRGVGTCVSVEAELLYMAYRSDRIEDNLRDVRRFLDGIGIYGIDGRVADSFARVKAAAMARFGPRNRAQRRHATIHQIGFSDNDLWIAAIAQRNNLIVVSGDRDFARLAQAIPLRHESWQIPDAG